jgi:hypothetical protein
MSWFNKRKVTIDTKKECDKGISWTLIDNDNCVVKRFLDSSGVVRYLYDNEFNAKEWIDETVQHEVSKELLRRNNEKFNKHFTFFINKDVAPLLLNKMDAMECVGQWEIEQSEMFPDMVRVKYCASKQVLFQTSNGVAIHGD